MPKHTGDQVLYMAALLCVLLAVLLCVAYVYWIPDSTAGMCVLVKDVIANLIAALIVFLVLYMVFTRQGFQIPTLQKGSRSSDQLSRKMRYIEAEVERIDTTLVKPSPPTTKLPAAVPAEVLVVVDIQNDFFEDGLLSVAHTDSLIAPINAFIRDAEEAGLSIVFTQDWHPNDHKSFLRNKGEWPVHCVQGSFGAELHSDLYVPERARRVRFGTAADADGYSPFENREMDDVVNNPHVHRVYVTGIALEYCVQATCLEARRRKKEVLLIEPLVRAAEQSKVSNVLKSLERSGVKCLSDVPSLRRRESSLV